MNPIIEKLIKEHKDLFSKIDNLSKFLDKDNILTIISLEEYGYMCQQLQAMICYADSLELRLNIKGVYLNDNKYITQVA